MYISGESAYDRTDSDFYIAATNNASAALKGVSADFDHISASAKTATGAITKAGQQSGGGFAGLSATIGKLTGGLSGLSSLLGVAGVGAAALGIGKAALDFGELAAQAGRTQQRLAAFAGGSSNAAAAVRAITSATDGALGSMTAAASASRLFAMGLATNATEAANMAKAALMLGDAGATAEQKINDWSLMMANQSVERLDQFGISSGKVRDEITRLQAATPGLSRETAFQNVVMAEAATKMAALAAAGVKVGTENDRLAAQWENLRLTMGKPIEGVIKVAKEGAAGALEGLNANLTGSADAANAVNALQQLEFANRRVAAAQLDLANVTRAGATDLAGQAQINLDVATADQKVAAAAYDAARGTAQYSSDMAAARNGATGYSRAVSGADRRGCGAIMRPWPR